MEYIRIGFITNILGIKGELKVEPLTDDIKRFDELECCFIDMGKYRQKVYLERYRLYKKKNIVMKFKYYDNADNVLKFKGRYIEVDTENIVKLEKGHYFIFQIIDCQVYSTEGEELGKVVEVLQPGGNDVYVVKGPGGDILIPAIKDIVKNVDVENKIIRVDLPEGLIE